MSEPTVLISPAPGQNFSELAAALLRLAADRPHDVQWRPREVAFEVPEQVAADYAAQAAEGAPAGPEPGGAELGGQSAGSTATKPARSTRSASAGARRPRGKKAQGGAVNG